MRTAINFSTKEELEKAIKDGIAITLISTNGVPPCWEGLEFVDGPHYPEPRTWHATVEMKEGKVVKIIF